MRRILICLLCLLCMPALAQDLDRRVFSAPGFGYTLLIPSGWADIRDEDFTAKFMPDVKDVSVTIQNRLAPLPGMTEESVAAVLLDYNRGLEQDALNKQTHRNAAFYYDGPNGQLTGHQMVVDFDLFEADGSRVALRQWAVIVPRPEGEVIHMWLFTAPLDQFETHLPDAQLILDSWVIRRGL